MTKIPALTQIENLKSNLLQALHKRDEAQLVIDQATKQIETIRAVLAGIEIGQQEAMERKED